MERLQEHNSNRKMKHTTPYIVLLALAMLGSCSGEDGGQAPPDTRHVPMTFRITYPGETRATETAFEAGDRIGLFVASDSLPLETGGNLVNNEPLTLNNGTWAASQTLYWSDGTFNAYAYYPYMSGISSIEEQPFSVRTDQSTAKTANALGGYEASDLLYASATRLRASASPINLAFRHVLSRLKIQLIKGEDYKGDLPANAQVYVHNTVADATINLSTGVVTRKAASPMKTIRARKEGDFTYSAIIVPQTIAYRMPLVEVVADGVSYMFESKFTFKPGVQHRANLIISDNPNQMKIEIGGEIVNP